jgi:hypothetical protein
MLRMYVQSCVGMTEGYPTPRPKIDLDQRKARQGLLVWHKPHMHPRHGRTDRSMINEVLFRVGVVVLGLVPVVLTVLALLM